MKIHFSNVNLASNSGPNSFAKRLAFEFKKRDIEIVGKDEYYDIFLCFIEPLSIPRKGCKFIQRLDGIWFKPEQFMTHNRNIRYAYENCDHVIWQSEFDKTMTLKHFGMPNKGSIIRNGIEKRKINPSDVHPEIKAIRSKYKRVFVCAANWHKQKRLKENVELFLKFSNNEDILLVLGNNPDYLIKNERVLYLGGINHELCLQVYSVSDWFIHLAWLDHCPNVVVEALSQNCPVICTDSGGTKEIVKENGIIIPEETKYNFDLLDYDKPYSLNIDNIELTLDKKEVKFDLDISKVADQYIEVFNENIRTSTQ